jgi:hypothetical protein
MDSLRDVFASGEPFTLEVTMRMPFDQASAENLRIATESGKRTVVELLMLFVASTQTTKYKATSQKGDLLYDEVGSGLWISPDLVK